MTIKYDFYQTEAKVVIDILLKNAKDKNCKVEIGKQSVHLTADEGVDLTINLLKEVDVDKSTYKLFGTKVEVILFKTEGIMWSALEQQAPAAPVAAPVNKEKKNWDKLAKEVEKQEEEETQGEAALQNLFAKIYSGADENTKRAMNKSFIESGGTVLSTNWNEVGSKQVEVKPPDGCEYKTFKS